MPHRLRFLLPLFVLAACSEDQPPTGPTESGDKAESHAPGHKVVNSLADPGNGVCNAAQCTLREAINDPASTEITFAAGLTGPIRLAPPGAGGGQLDINKQLSITGPTARIAIRGRIPDLPFPVFRIGKQGAATLTNLIIQGGGNGITNRGTLTVDNSILSGNGIGIASNFSGPLTVSRSQIADNGGSGVISRLALLTLTDIRIVRNGGRGIALFRGSMTLANSTIARNGGGIANLEGSVEIVSSTIANNSASGPGGGILNAVDNPTGRQSADVTLLNSTISGNSASAGGGVHNSGRVGSAVVVIRNSTVVRNSANEAGGGIVQETSIDPDAPNAIALTNSIVAQNTAQAGPDLLVSSAAGSFVGASFSLIGDGTGSGITNTNGNQVGTAAAPIDPRLAPLANYGGPTQTHRLLLGSPAIDAASAADCPATDQRGVPRPQGAGCDIGSFERK